MSLSTHEEAAALDEVRRAFARLERARAREPHPSLEDREGWLDCLIAALSRERYAVVEACSRDFGARAPTETLTADVLMTLESLRHARRHLRTWAARRPVATQWYMRPSRAFVAPQPLGVVGVIAPWNYPVNLALAPLSAALSAGNRVILKPSEATPRTAALLARLVQEALPAEVAAVVCGGTDVARAVGRLPLAHLLFTGSTAVGREVARAAAEHLVPVTLELGGKSPAIMHPSYDVARFAERVASGKLFNAGQTCIAPDYVLLPTEAVDTFVSVLTRAARAHEERLAEPTAIIHDRAFARLAALVEDARQKGARVIPVAPADAAARRMPLVILVGVDASMNAMQEEIFGPVLPVLTYERLEDALRHVRAQPAPLALYYFDEDPARVEQVLAQTVSGGVSVNATLLHFAQDALPFGGVGPSGMGRYHGEQGFDTFSNLRGVFVESELDPSPRLLTLPVAWVERSLGALIGGRRRPGEP
jgi:coniferyl-aldehyde dehydrogenase